MIISLGKGRNHDYFPNVEIFDPSKDNNQWTSGKIFLEIKCQNVRNEVDQVLRQHLFKMGLTKEGKKKNSSFNGLDFDAIFYFFVRLTKKWSKTKLLQIKIDNSSL